MAPLTFTEELADPLASDEREAILAAPVFGSVFSDHMVTASYDESGWHDARLTPYGPISLDPSTAVFHYAQAVFEGLKAYRQADGGVALFRPDRNAARLAASCRRLVLPALDEADFVAACELLVSTDRAWVPSADGSSLYLRPFVWASDAALGVRPSRTARFTLIASPAAGYFSGPPRPVTLWVSREFVRAAPGGTGAAKCGGNYAASLAAQEQAIANGCDQSIFLDAVEHRWVEELGGMNVVAVLDDGTLVTPDLEGGTILDGVTRDSLLTLARDAGRRVEERRLSIDEVTEGATSGRVAELFACGTAAVVTSVGSLRSTAGEVTIGDGGPGPVAAGLRAQLLDIQHGRADDPHGWRHPVAWAG